MTDISPQERLSWLRLFRSENVGVKAFYDLLKLYGSAEEALLHAEELSRRGGRKKSITLCPQSKAEEELELAEKHGATIIIQAEQSYPELLSYIDDAPPVLTVLGNLDMLHRPAIAMVGARNASANGCRFAYRLAEELGENEHVVVSGLARGIDTAAHKGSVSTGTIAVVAGGVDDIYPPENAKLRESIIEQGAVISEMPFGAIPKAQHFPRRNRIISGLAHGTVVVEASLRSGSLITTRYAMEHGREVFAVPGSPLDPRAEGPNKLLKQGASLIESAKDIFETLHYTKGPQEKGMEETNIIPFDLPAAAPPDEQELTGIRDIIKSQLGTSPVAIDDLAEACDIPVHTLLTVLLELELAGHLSRHPGNKVSLLAA